MPEKIQCEYCGKEMDKRGYNKHKKFCGQNDNNKIDKHKEQNTQNNSTNKEEDIEIKESDTRTKKSDQRNINPNDREQIRLVCFELECDEKEAQLQLKNFLKNGYTVIDMEQGEID